MNATHVLLVKYGEIALRGKNRFAFENMLITTIRKALNPLGNFYVKKEQGRFVVEGEWGKPFPMETAISQVTKIFGVVSVCPAIRSIDQDIESLKQLALLDMEQYKDKEAITFKVDTTRAIKKYPMLSNEISACVGEFLLEHMPNLTVDVKKPQVRLRLELRNDAYVYSHVVQGLGGLPPGSAGKAVLLLSGGIDSPVAGFLAAKRGIEVIGVYFHSPPYTSERAKEKVKDLATILSRFTGKMKLYVVNFTQTQLYLCEHVPPEKLTIFLKRSMLKTADLVAKKENALALVTGDSVGQVASQTLHSLHSMSSATTLPILRPLACFDKQEIIALAQQIGTYETSILPYEDCCTLFLPERPEIKPKTSIIESIENALCELPMYLEEAAKNAEVVWL